MVTTRGDGAPYHFRSRFFAPGSGVEEDPVTGSAHCCLGPYWARKLGLTRLMAHQDSERGGELEVEIRGDRVLLTGRALTLYQAPVSRRWPTL